MFCTRRHVLRWAVMTAVAMALAMNHSSPLSADAYSAESVTESALVDTALVLREQLTAFDALLPSSGASAPPPLLVIHGEITATEASLDFFIGAAARLLTGDHKDQLNLLRGLLEKLQQLKDKLTAAIIDEAVSDEIRRAAATPLATSESLQSLIVIALTCRSEVDC